MSTSALAEIPYPHIEVTERGIPILAGTTMKVVELVMAQAAHGWSPEELHFQYPHLSMSQIHGALTYYWDHQKDLDADIERRAEFATTARREAESSPIMRRLRALKRVP